MGWKKTGFLYNFIITFFLAAVTEPAVIKNPVIKPGQEVILTCEISGFMETVDITGYIITWYKIESGERKKVEEHTITEVLKGTITDSLTVTDVKENTKYEWVLTIEKHEIVTRIVTVTVISKLKDCCLYKN